MGIETDLNVSPYFDDANNAINDNYHRILFRPQVPVQARELTQLQDILQNQVERFGDNIFTAGTIIKGCSFSYDTNYNYVKVLDLRPVDNQPVQPSSYVGMIGYEATSNLYAVCVNFQDGYESQDPDLKTLYFKYINTGTAGESAFSPGSQITFYQTTDIATATANSGINAAQFANADVTVASVTNAVGKGYAMTVGSGVIFQKGHFIQVPSPETTIISKYSSYPSNVVAGFLVSENIVTEYQDTNLLDNATGYSNLNAPGAHRLQLMPSLVAYDTASVPSNNFFSLVEWENGNIVKSFQETQYSVIGNEMARREYETNGNFVVRPFKVTMQDANSTHNFAVVSAGLAYVDGHRVETLNNINVPVRKGTDTKISKTQTIQTSYDNSVIVGEFVGTIPTNVGATISLRDTPGAKVSNGQFANGTPAGNEIGTAKALAVQYESGVVGAADGFWRISLADIRMNAGKNFRDARAIHYNGGSSNAHADIARAIDASASNTYTARIKNPGKSALVFPTSKKGLVNLTQSSNFPQYIYRTISNTSINKTSGISSVITLSNTTVFPYGANVTLTQAQESSILIIPTAMDGGATYANVTLTKSGNLVVTANSANVIANASTTTAFNTDYQIGDYIAAAGVIRRITNISNSTFMTVDNKYVSTNASATHNKCYPLNVPINIVQRNSKVQITDSAAQNMQITLLAANGAAETLSSNIAISVHHNAKQPAASDRNLQANSNIVVKINTSNNASGKAGPWYLGVPYVHKLKKVYKSSNTGTFVTNTASGNTYLLANTSGFSNGAAVFGSGIPAGATANVANSTAFVLSAAPTATANYIQVKWAYYSNAAKDDVTSSFSLNRNAKDAFFDHSFVSVNAKGCPISDTDLLTVVFDAMKPGSQGTGHISAGSYSTLVNNGTLNYEDIHSHTTRNGHEHFLRDSIDCRPFAVNTAAYANTVDLGTCNPVYVTNLGDISNNTPTANTELYLVAPDQIFQHDVYNYVGRIDKLIMNSYGKFQIIEGQPADNPVPPADVKGAMTIATINIPPFPSYVKTLKTSNVAASYVTTSTIAQNRVYTMKDIAKLDKRVDNLEYYTSLNLLEQKTSKLTIVSDVTGANRFKNGIFVDNFETTDLLDTTSPEYKIGLSTSETALVPRYVEDIIKLRYGTGTGVSANGSVVRLQDNPTTSEVSIISQDLATESTKCAEANYTYNGVAICVPPFPPIPDPTPIIKDPVKPVEPPKANTASPLAAAWTSNLGSGSAKAGDSIQWVVGAIGYASASISITGPGGFSYSRSFTPSIAATGQFSASGFIDNAKPGTYTMTVTKTLLSGYTELAVTLEPSSTVVTPVVTAITNDPAKGVGTDTGVLNTVVVANTDTIVIPPIAITPGGFDVNFGLTINVPVMSFGLGSQFGSFIGETTPITLNPFNTPLISVATGTANSTTVTTSTANTAAVVPLLPGTTGSLRVTGGGVPREYKVNQV